jgi:hypothetical protein
MASPPKHETWPRPKQVRHAWVANHGRMMPRQGLVVEWRNRSSGWTALVAYVNDVNGRNKLIVEWFRASELWPVVTDPNQRGRYNGTDEPDR